MKILKKVLLSSLGGPSVYWSPKKNFFFYFLGGVTKGGGKSQSRFTKGGHQREKARGVSPRGGTSGRPEGGHQGHTDRHTDKETGGQTPGVARGSHVILFLFH